MVNPQETTNMTAPESANKTKMVQPPHMNDTRMGEDAPKRFKVKMIKQLDRHDRQPGDLPPVTAGLERIFTMRGVNDGLQSYPEYAVLDVEPEFAKQCCEDNFKGQYTH